METSLSLRGYSILKDTLSDDELSKIKEELTMTPIVIDGYGPNNPLSFKTFMESRTKIYIPKFYGLQKFGIPTSNKMKEGESIDLSFNGKLRALQEDASTAMIEACEDPKRMGGLLCLRCGEGKTITAIYLLCRLGRKTMIIIHKEFLLEQWKERIGEFAPNARIGLIKAKTIDVENKDIVLASVQSLSMKEYEPTLFDSFGTLIIDECHHMGSQVFSQALKKLNVKYSIGLTATPKRKDGLTKVFTSFLGDIVFISAKRKDNMAVQFKEYYDSDPVYSKEHTLYNKKPNMARMINAICNFEKRTDFLIQCISDVLVNEPNRKVLLLSDRRQHLHDLHEKLKKTQYTSGYYYGGMSAHDLKQSEEKQILLATYQYASEGFDMKGLDTLVLASPKTDVVQVVGRILRDKPEDRKNVPLVIDIVDSFSMFVGQAKKRYKYYKSCKYDIEGKEIFTPIKNKVIAKGVCSIVDVDEKIESS